jgi:methionyl-tRNA formyltransferase
MSRKIIFLGNDGNLIKIIAELQNIELIGVVADEVFPVSEKYFGSSYSFGKQHGVLVISQNDFNNKYEHYLNGPFKEADILFLQGYRYRIKAAVLEKKRLKVINFHQSLLPQYSGRHPLNWAIIKGEKVTGITFHYAHNDFDTGDVIIQLKIRITSLDTIVSLYNKTIRVASKYIRRVFSLINDDSFIPKPQNVAERTYFPPRTPQDGEILSTDKYIEIRNKIRALIFPYPGAFVLFKGKKLIIEGVRPLRNEIKYRRIRFVEQVDNHLIIRAHDKLLMVTKFRSPIQEQ